jgi:hypothetical protein
VLEVLHRRYRQNPASYWSDLVTRNGASLGPLFRVLEWAEPRLPTGSLLCRPLVQWRQSENPSRHRRNNDYFWSFEAVRFMPSFRVATVEAGLRFAFEAAPATCFAMNGHRLPFGCHAWTKFDRAFWEPHLLTGLGSQVVPAGSGSQRDGEARGPAVDHCQPADATRA